MVLPNFVRWALANQPITIHGDGSQTRSFTWVGDVVWAMTALINEPRAAGQVFNIGNGEEISIRDLARRVRTLTNSSSELHFVSYEQAFDRTFEDMPRRVPDIGKLRRLVGYEPRVQLNGIIESVIRYWNSDLRATPAPAVAGSARRPLALGPAPQMVGA
jgi:UDP-glucose 4-epimerase